MSRTPIDHVVRQSIAAFWDTGAPRNDTNTYRNVLRDEAMKTTARLVLLGSSVADSVSQGLTRYKLNPNKYEPPKWLEGLLERLGLFIEAQ